MEESRKTEVEGCGGGGDGDTASHATAGHLGDEDIVAWLSMEDETVDDLMKFLDTDPSQGGVAAPTTSTARVKFISNPYSSPLIFQSSCSYITINGNEDSCGSSFSDWESSVMASVDMGGIRKDTGGGAWESNGGEMSRGFMEMGGEGVKDGCDGVEWDWDEDFIN